MAQQVIVQMLDDLDGSDEADTVRFGLDGQSYLIDLSNRNAGRLRNILGPYLPHARKVGRRGAGHGRLGTRVTARATDRDRDYGRRVRAWAAEQGVELSERGRIPAEVVQAFQRRDKPGAVDAIDPLAYSPTVRRWATDNGHDVISGGRLPDEVLVAYRAATKPRRRRRSPTAA